MVLQQAFHFCPSCGAPGLKFDGKNRYSCDACAFSFYQNTAAACGAILTLNDRILLLKRGKEPAAGMLDFPGGFIDPGESAEEALRREIREEIGVPVEDLRYFRSAPNVYRYRNVSYPTCDLVFTGRISRVPEEIQRSEIAAFGLYSRDEIRLEEIAFPSLRAAMAAFLSETAQDQPTP